MRYTRSIYIRLSIRPSVCLVSTVNSKTTFRLTGEVNHVKNNW